MPAELPALGQPGVGECLRSLPEGGWQTGGRGAFRDGGRSAFALGLVAGQGVPSGRDSRQRPKIFPSLSKETTAMPRCSSTRVIPALCPAMQPLITGMVVGLGLVMVGCAGPLPWKDANQIALERERYGLTADQRIRELRQQATAARDESLEEQAGYSNELARAMLAEHDPRVRAEMLTLAAGFDDPAARAICVGGLDDPDAMVRTAACDAWVKIGGTEAVRHLAHRFRSDDDIDVRIYAVRCLGSLGDEAAVPVLAEALEAPDPAVQYRAVASLKEVSGRDFGNDVNVWREWAADPEAVGQTWSLAETWRRLF